MKEYFDKRHKLVVPSLHRGQKREMNLNLIMNVQLDIRTGYYKDDCQHKPAEQCRIRMF